MIEKKYAVRIGLCSVLALFSAGACSAGKIGGNAVVPVRPVYSFDGPEIPTDTQLENVQAELFSGRGVTDGPTALKVVYPPDTLYKKVAFEPEAAWDLSDMGACCIALDITNLSDESAQLFMVLKSGTQSVTGHINIGAGKSGTFYYDLAGPNQAMNPGMTGWPPRPTGEIGGKTAAVPFQYAWGDRVLDLSALNYIGLYMKGNLTERTLVFDRIRIGGNPAGNAAELKNLVDAFGQYGGADWKGKAHSEKELQQQAKREAKALSKKPRFDDRSTFGGWKTGPKLEATGYFRAEKYEGKWSLVDPEGYLFFATGIANCRLSNTFTVTGEDYKNADEKQGLFTASELRRNLFSWLPEEDDPLAAHYGYINSIHTGPLKQGQTFSFFAANLQRKYGDDYFARWREVTLARMQNWGFTCFGNWTDPQFYGNGRVAYFANAWITGNHKRVSTGNDYWGPIHDPFDPEFVQSARHAAEKVNEEVQGDPWCIGVFIDNELSWGNDGGDANRFGLVINTLAQAAETCPAKAAFTALLKTKYGAVQKLNEAWGVSLESWEAFSAEFKHEGELSGERRADFSLLSEALAAEYFSVVNRELKALMPHHLYCGSRFADWGMTPEAVRAAAKHTDVIGCNLYTEGLPGHFGEWINEIDRPFVLGEFHFGATDRGMFHGGICTAANQKDRGVKYSAYMQSVIENPHFVGAHWFQYIDSPTAGRAVDGENYNSGFISVTDHPYEELIDAVRRVNRNLYPARFGKGAGK